MAETDSLIEALAALEHEQWAQWTRYFLRNLTVKNAERWGRQAATEYKDLPESERGSDRDWARKVLQVIESNRRLTERTGDGKVERWVKQYSINPRFLDWLKENLPETYAELTRERSKCRTQ